MSDILDIVLRQIISGENEGLNMLQVIKILLREVNAFQSWRGRVGDLFIAFACGREDDFAGLAMLAVNPPAIIDRLNDKSLRICVVLAFFPELSFAGGELLDDLLHGNRRRFFRNA